MSMTTAHHVSHNPRAHVFRPNVPVDNSAVSVPVSPPLLPAVSPPLAPCEAKTNLHVAEDSLTKGKIDDNDAGTDDTTAANVLLEAEIAPTSFEGVDSD